MDEQNIVITRDDVFKLKEYFENNTVIFMGIGLSILILSVCVEINKKI